MNENVGEKRNKKGEKKFLVKFLTTHNTFNVPVSAPCGVQALGQRAESIPSP